MVRCPAAELGGYCRTMGNPLAYRHPAWSPPDGLQSQKAQANKEFWLHEKRLFLP